MKRLLLLLLMAVISYNTSATTVTTDTAQPTTQRPRLKEKNLTAETLIATGTLAKSKKLSAQQLAALCLKRIDKGFDPQLQYRLVDTLYKGNGHYILLLGQWYDYENKAWVASYAGRGKLVDYKLVFYDNAEGFLSVETSIKTNIITITTYNEYEDAGAQKKKERFAFGANYKLQKL